jgi:uroporphyrinogen-III synthase
VLLTGPAERLEEYAHAASRAGWDAVPHPLLAIEPRPFDRSEIGEARFDWICVTSSSAIPYLEGVLEALPSLRATPCAVVGDRTAERLREAGLQVSIGPARDARSLAEALRARARDGGRVLWPRGSRSDDLARELRKAGLSVSDPLAYSSRAVESATLDAPPPAEAVFFASPSAVRVWHETDGVGERRIAIAIGETTFHALLEETEPRFFDTISLPQPTPEALGFVLAHLELENSP